jgi:hypothetical protein
MTVGEYATGVREEASEARARAGKAGSGDGRERANVATRLHSLDAFRGLDGLELAVRIAVVSGEGPNELGTAADIVIGGPEALTALLRRLL